MMLKELTQWGHKLRDGINLAHSFHETHGASLPKTIKKIAFVGMGGSGVAGRIMKTFLDDKPGIQVTIVDSPIVPAHIDSQTVAIVMSYSGNTWETLDALAWLTEKFVPTIVLAHGGKAAEIAQKKNLPLVVLPKSLTPRSALGHYLGFLATFLDLTGVLPGNKLAKTWIDQAEKYVPLMYIKGYFDNFLEISKNHDFLHVWGVSDDSASVAYRGATQFNENSKLQAVSNQFPELAHNLVVGFQKFTTPPCVLFFHTDFLSAHMTGAIQAICQILQERGVSLYKPPLLGDTRESQIFNMILWADFASYYLGHVRGVEIERVQLIEELKQALGN